MTPIATQARRLGAIALTLLLSAFGATSAEAAGYWTCEVGEWIAVGSPTYEKPLNVCGVELELPKTRFACERAGGDWGPAGLFPKPICVVPTHDAGRPCADNGECEGLCLAELTEAQRDRVMRGESVRRLGRCAVRTPVFGCLATVEKGVVASLICLD